jgi:hypothetical protein
MNLIQRGTTASRANRGKSVNTSIAQSKGGGGYAGNQDPFRLCAFPSTS